MVIDEQLADDGSMLRTHVQLDEGHLLIVADDGVRGRLSADSLARLIQRYGKPLSDEVVVAGDTLELGDGRLLTRLDYRAPVDLEAKTYLVWSEPGAAPIAALAPGVAAALRFLVSALAARRQSP